MINNTKFITFATQLKISKPAKKHIIHKQEKNQFKETDPKVTDNGIANKENKIGIINAVHIFKKEDEHLNIWKKGKMYLKKKKN